MAKMIWKGFLSFGLVNIPVQLFSAIQAHSVGFNLLHDTCHTRIKYERYCPHCQKEVPWQDIVHGLKVGDRQIIFTQAQLKQLKPEKSNVIEITEFIDADTLPPIYYENHYYLQPLKDKAGSKAFSALKHVNKIAIARLIFHEKEHVCAIQPYETTLLLSTLHYAPEIRELTAIKGYSESYSKEELDLAEKLIRGLYKTKPGLAKFKDTFAQKVETELKKGTRRPKALPVKKKEKKIKPHKPSLVDSLKASIKKKVKK